MGGVLLGFGIIGFVILVGYIAARLRIGGPEAGFVLNRIAFFITGPALLFTVLAQADIGDVFSVPLLVALISAVSMAAIYLVINLVFWRDPLGRSTIGSMASGYVNANNIGLPVAVYVLGDAHYVAPLIVIQLVIFAPIGLAILDISARGSVSFGAILSQPIRNPLIIASLTGLVIAVLGIELPDAVLAPFELLGGAAVPLILMAFGMSLSGQKPFAANDGRSRIVVASTLKTVAMPAVAWLIASLGFGLSGPELFAVVTLAALPTAQNIFNYASRYDTGVVLARDTVLATTLASVPVIVVIAALLA
ncbi:AEC family transporter [Labedella endophytica]|uniref:AEC family transporter n=1 Tax=Labedella endophytica TaxID=1523160 RepID=A0A3S1CSQ6_9MICO|nr:AEC family transporter [Labedella endophytica]RUR01606.1 AEC family transporter [Labedella endophytica]